MEYKIEIKAYQINQIVKQIGLNWNQKWSHNIQLLQNQINVYINYQLIDIDSIKDQKIKNRMQSLLGADILRITTDPHQKLILIHFSKSFRKPQPILRHPMNTVDSINSSLSLIDTDFSILVFKIIHDQAFLVHLLPRYPDMIAFSEYPDSYNNDVKSGYKFEFKQINWLIHKYQESSKVILNIFPIGLEVQLACLKNEWYLLIPPQNGRQIECFNINETLKLPYENDKISIFLDPVNRQKYYKQIVTRQVLNKLYQKLNINDLQSLDSSLVFNLLIQDQLLLNFPIQNPGLIITTITQKIDTITAPKTSLCHLFPQQAMTEACFWSQECSYSSFDISKCFNIKKIRELCEQQLDPYNIFLSIQQNDGKEGQIIFRLTTQYYLFNELCFTHLESLKSIDNIGQIKNLIHIYNKDLQTSLTIPNYQKIKYPISKVFLTRLNAKFQQQQEQYDLFISSLEPYLLNLKLSQITDLFKRYQSALDQILLEHTGTKQDLVNYFIYVIKSNNNSFAIPQIPQ